MAALTIGGRSVPETQSYLLTTSGPALTSFDAYAQQGGFTGLRQALTTMTPAQVLGELRAAGLRGRGGAGVLTAEKLKLVAQAVADEKYLVCNAYDADMRSAVASSLLERNPFLVIEGIALAAYAIGATEAYLYVRSSRTAAAENIRAALTSAQERNALGRGIFGSQTDLNITLVGVERGFMAGEESSLLEIIKGRPMKAQQRPPYPTEYGLQGQPTVVQNVETLANLPVIVARGGDTFRKVGTEGSPGTKLLTVIWPGVPQGVIVEVAFGTKLRDVLAKAGASVNESTVRAVVVGGGEGGALPLSLLDTPYDYEPLEEIGVIVGSSIIELLPADTCMVRWATERSNTLARESCGKCVPCRVGVKRIGGTLEGIISSLGSQDDLALLSEFAQYVPDGSLCGFGVNAVKPLTTAMKYFADDFTAHLNGTCPTGVCEPMRAHRYATKHVL
jgi:NADH-quinone oxidoreductase subunit F